MPPPQARGALPERQRARARPPARDRGLGARADREAFDPRVRALARAGCRHPQSAPRAVRRGRRDNCRRQGPFGDRAPHARASGPRAGSDRRASPGKSGIDRRHRRRRRRPRKHRGGGRGVFQSSRSSCRTELRPRRTRRRVGRRRRSRPARRPLRLPRAASARPGRATRQPLRDLRRSTRRRGRPRPIRCPQRWPRTSPRSRRASGTRRPT